MTRWGACIYLAGPSNTRPRAGLWLCNSQACLPLVHPLDERAVSPVTAIRASSPAGFCHGGWGAPAGLASATAPSS